ncbi:MULTISPECIES: hypothetical protein [Halobacteriales]|uniref:Uncharacterized protein n=2 Tax=Halobacteriales TaxID=2235 RepID=A0A1I0NRC5_9EURY|nr:hypothetical protein [Natrinema salifodinae]SEW04126.1 hypothetical protein SAMN05216285_2036 [Natrinema salifodinae]
MKAFDLSPIVRNFYRDIFENDDRPDYEAYALLAIPGLFSLIAFTRPVDSDFIGMMSTALAILFGFTFSTLMTTAKYSTKDDRIEEMVVQQTRVGTSYALLVNLISLISIVLVSVLVEDYSQLSYPVATGISIVVYALMFHYLLVMVYLMRYLYLLAIGGAFEQSPRTEPRQERGDENEPQERTI